MTPIILSPTFDSETNIYAAANLGVMKAAYFMSTGKGEGEEEGLEKKIMAKIILVYTTA